MTSTGTEPSEQICRTTFRSIEPSSPERLVGYGRKSKSVQRDVVLAIDQSGSMASSVVYASVFGAVLASMQALKTSLVVFDTAVVDLTDKLSDPVDVLFGTQLGGGTDINRAIAYSQSLISRPAESMFVLISDLYEGGIRNEMLRRMAAMKNSGVQVVVLLALSDDGGTVVRSRQCSVAECPRDSRVCVHAGQVSGTAGGGSGTRGGRVGLGGSAQLEQH